eukprot:TRINITY_DN2855_c0_g1_i2.p1 TRINITY_DN2855_c0_g1~~TRINITY_DN2855_c0_g1_i2.p1  ORF type:complete len:357 (-),score=88.08 TRINITY_DN2855_c0_g1_i2:508-1578(-)
MATCFSTATCQVPLSLEAILSYGPKSLLLKRPSRVCVPKSHSAPSFPHIELCISRSESSVHLGPAGARKCVPSIAAFAQDSAVAANAVEDEIEEGPPEPGLPGGEAEGEEGLQDIESETEESGFVDRVYPQERTRLHVANIPYDINSEALANLFQGAGEVMTAEIICDRFTGRSRGFGFISMSKPEEATEAINKFNGCQFGGRVLKVSMSVNRGGGRQASPAFGVDSPFKVFVANLPWSTDSEMLRETFSKCGDVVGAKIIYERETGRSRGFGFVSFSSQSGVDAAMSQMDGMEMGGRVIRVRLTREAENAFDPSNEESKEAENTFDASNEEIEESKETENIFEASNEEPNEAANE